VEDLAQVLLPHKNKGLVMLYSNGTDRGAQARDDLFRQGFKNVSFLTGGLEGFLNVCLKPVSLRTAPVTPDAAAKINAWRAFFLVS